MRQQADPTERQKNMDWKPVKRGKKWVARYQSPITGQRQIAKPRWNGGSGTFEKRADAAKAIREAYEAELASDGERVTTVGAYHATWLDRHPRSPRTADSYRRKVGTTLDIKLEGRPLRDWDIRQLRRRHAHDLADAMFAAGSRTVSGVKGVFRPMSAMWEDAITDEYTEVNPFRGVKIADSDPRAGGQRRRRQVWSFEDLHEFASYAGEHEASYLAMIDCGMRLGEMLALPRDAHRDHQLRVEGTAWNGQVSPSSRNKNHGRSVPTSPRLEAALRKRVTRIDVPWLFPTVTGKLWRERNWREYVHDVTTERANTPERVAARGGRILDPKPHEMRHSWVSNLRAAGIDPADLAAMAGHSVATATKVYTHALNRSTEAVREAVA
jgi:integrase